MIFLELHIYISELPFIAVWNFLSPFFLKVQGNPAASLKTNFVGDNILPVIFSK